MPKEYVPKEKIKKYIGRDITRTPQCVGKGGCIGGELVSNIEERRECDMQCVRREPDMWLKGVAIGSDAVELVWINSIRKGWIIKEDQELAPGA